MSGAVCDSEIKAVNRESEKERCCVVFVCVLMDGRWEEFREEKDSLRSGRVERRERALLRTIERSSMR